MTYPPEHKAIVNALTNGQFILYPDTHYMVVQREEVFYRDFFKATFGYDLHVRSEGYIFLSSEEAVEKDSRNFLIFLAVFCREMGIAGRDFREEFGIRRFQIEEVRQILENSSKRELIESILGENGLAKLLNDWNRRRVVEFTNAHQTQFKFTSAVNLFFEYALELADMRLKDESEFYRERETP
ncbi:MAG: hypothetical protein KF734_08935 [Saprospiraceae bacterium]|nr:hypothetical protein [Saprospiraceae bacterium]